VRGQRPATPRKVRARIRPLGVIAQKRVCKIFGVMTSIHNQARRIRKTNSRAYHAYRRVADSVVRGAY